MNTYMIMFTVMGLIYLGLLTWGLVALMTGTIIISVVGLAICFLGHRYSFHHLS